VEKVPNRQQIPGQTQVLDARRSGTLPPSSMGAFFMFNRDALDQLTQQIGNLFGEKPLTADLQRNMRALLQSALTRLDVVTREEFDTQAAVLAQTRTKLDQLEIQLLDLAKQLGSSAIDNPPR
jgi:BMFP domain-containing protein YqiC